MKIIVFSALLLVSCSSQKFDFVPDVVPEDPLSVLYVRYGLLPVNNGTELTPTETRNEPVVYWHAEEGSYHTVAMVDPDAPSRTDPQLREILHWMVVNIPGNIIVQGEEIAEYLGPAPPVETGLHRYVLLLFIQPGKLSFDEQFAANTFDDTRQRFSIYTFAQKYNFTMPAKGGNYFTAQYED